VRRATALLGVALAACARAPERPAPSGGSAFDRDLTFLRAHTSVAVLTDPSTQAQVVVAPEYQGRVLTSTTGGGNASGASGAPSFGWIGRDAIASHARQAHMNVFGGEDRFWLGPEGGQYALYFKRGDPFDLDHWQVPGAIDWGAWETADRSDASVRLHARATLTNYAGTALDVDVDRTVRLLGPGEVAAHLTEPPGPGVRAVAFESSNTVANAGRARWQPDTGLISVWILGQFMPSADTTIALPFTPGSEAALGPVVNDKYFGAVPGDRLATRGSTLLFRGDGRYRSKIGLSPARALDVAGSYDASARVLTIVQYTRPAGATAYVNSMWEQQREPYKGDVVNSYNDGPPAPGKPPLGPFYELETSSPALALAPGERYTHVHRTIHLVGPENELDRIARAALHVSLADLSGAFAR
jgi:uncharacterized protein DUF6786